MFHFLIKQRTPAYKSTYIIICLLVISFFLSGCVGSVQGDHASEKVKPADIKEQAMAEKNIVRKIKSIDILPGPDRIEVLIKGNEKLTYTSVKQSFPLGITIYLPETGIDGCSVGNLPEQKSISSIAVSYAGREKINAKVVILLKQNLDYEVSTENSDLKIMVYNKVVNVSENQQFNGQSTENHGDVIEDQKEESHGSSPVDISGAHSRLTGIAFTAKEDGGSEISIKTSVPVKYDIFREKNKNKLILNLYNTDIPKYRQRPFLTEYFRSAVNRILPVQRKKGEKSSHVIIEMREAVPYRIARNSDGLLLSFDPSSIPPLLFTRAEKIFKNGNAGTEQKSVKLLKTSNTFNGTNGKSQDQKSAEQNKGNLFQHKKVYTGEKIRVDFFETDIKNVFRIIAGVSQKNLAVDKDVTGNVTLSLDKPVPWDQVLDLVLKMNNLGMVEEGSIIRIATRKTLKREEEFRQAEFAARKHELDQKKSLEPLVTEYIPINYSNAKSDIEPHLKKILTPKRGHLSVDTRTNMIIMTDVKEKIAQAKEIINKLDKVTPQIMIAARIVEVSRNFSKQLGIDWSMASKTKDSDVRVFGGDTDGAGGNYGFDLAMNYPVASSSSIGYSFSHITGTPFVLDATLSASEVKGDVKIISSPKILTLDNKKAKIKQGLQYPYLERDDSGGSSVKFKDIDLLLEVTPHVTPDKRIAMRVHLTKDDVASITNGVPSLSTNEADTELLINDGDTIVIGGITKATINHGKTGFPFLSHIPGLGMLFSSTTKSDNRNELLIFITPSIVQLKQVKQN